MVTARSDDASLPPQQFFPKDRLCSVITESAVCAELFNKLSRTHSEEDIEGYAKTICNITRCDVGGRFRRRSYRSIFVILVLADKSDLITSFIDEEVSDLDLPLVPVRDSEGTNGMRRRSLNPDGTPQPLLACFDDDEWSPSSRDQFDRYQWCMLAPFFSKGRHDQINHYPLHDQHILPFLNWDQAEDDAAEREGGYGRVIMVRMHPAHHKLGGKTSADRGFAVKQLLASDRRSFKRERDMLKRFSGAKSHTHIVSLLATYRHRSKYHFVFDRAQSDLGKFWEKNERAPKLSHGDVIWISEQCAGIAAGLFKIHRHMTFKIRCAHKVLELEDNTSGTRQVTFAESAARAVRRPGVDACGAEHGAVNMNRTFSSENESLEQYEIKYGRHGDINPQNILWFNDDLTDSMVSTRDLRGVLKIADFGTVEMNSLFSKSGPRDVANTMTYRPPECDSADRTIRQSFDIWCLGCVFLEFATWMLGGDALVKHFAQQRKSRDPAYSNDKTDTYFELTWNKDTRKTQARVKPSVVEVVAPYIFSSANTNHLPTVR
jgi:serine/threonine protein kinase